MTIETSVFGGLESKLVELLCSEASQWSNSLSSGNCTINDGGCKLSAVAFSVLNISLMVLLKVTVGTWNLLAGGYVRPGRARSEPEGSEGLKVAGQAS